MTRTTCFEAFKHIEKTNRKFDLRVEKMILTKDKSAIKFNDLLLLEGVPNEAFNYSFGNRSALEWIIDQYRVKTDDKTGITHDPNNPRNPDYILRLIKKIINVSLETVKIVNTLRSLILSKD